MEELVCHVRARLWPCGRVCSLGRAVHPYHIHYDEPPSQFYGQPGGDNAVGAGGKDLFNCDRGPPGYDGQGSHGIASVQYVLWARPPRSQGLCTRQTCAETWSQHQPNDAPQYLHVKQPGLCFFCQLFLQRHPNVRRQSLLLV